MTMTIPAPARSLVLGAVIMTVLIALTSRSARGEKALECYNQNPAVCQIVQRCTGGFEANGSCQYMLVTKYSYWKN